MSGLELTEFDKEVVRILAYQVQFHADEKVKRIDLPLELLKNGLDEYNQANGYTPKSWLEKYSGDFQWMIPVLAKEWDYREIYKEVEESTEMAQIMLVAFSGCDSLELVDFYNGRVDALMDEEENVVIDENLKMALERALTA